MSLEIISGQEFGHFVIDNIVKLMRVTKGSFYWHFKDRNDFLEHLVTYWDENFTKNVMLHIGEAKGDASERLLELMIFVTRKRLARYDTAILSLAHNEPHVSNQIAEVFENNVFGHGQSFSGHALACAAALAGIKCSIWLGRQGLGPTRLIWPAKTLKSWGSSSSLVLRKKRPNFVIDSVSTR